MHLFTKFLTSLLTYSFLSVLALSQSTVKTDEITVDTDLVSLPVTISDKKGRYVSGLKREDFLLTNDGEPQRIDFFAAGVEPLSIAFLLDISPSTADVIGDIKRAAVELIGLLETNDRAMVVTFDAVILQKSPLTSNRIVLEEAIRKTDIGLEASTLMRDAVAKTISGSFGKRSGRKAIILLTDGMDFGSRTSNSLLIQQLEESDVMVFPVYFRTRVGTRGVGLQSGSNNSQRVSTPLPTSLGGGPMTQNQGRDFLKRYSKITAGRFFDKKNGDWAATFRSIVNELRKQYRIGFYPPENQIKGDSHKLVLKVNKKNLVIRHKSVYRSN